MLLDALIDHAGPDPEPALAELIGRLTAEMWTLRQMSLATAAKLAAGEDPMVEAAIVKDLGNAYEQAMPRLVQAVVEDVDLADDSRLARLLSFILVQSPSYSLRGGHPSVGGIIGRGTRLDERNRQTPPTWPKGCCDCAAASPTPGRGSRRLLATCWCRAQGRLRGRMGDSTRCSAPGGMGPSVLGETIVAQGLTRGGLRRGDR